MSTLSSLFNRASFGVRCKTCMNLAISRIKLLRNKRELQLKHMRKEISQYLQNGQEAVAHIRVEHIIREQNIMAAYEILELFCEFVLARVPILESQRDCPMELQEAIASIIFASPRCSDLPELMQVRSLFTTKYGKDFVSAASELRPDSNVNRTVIEKLSPSVPPSNIKLKFLKAIAEEYDIYWDSSSLEAEFSKKHEDLLVPGHATVFQETTKPSNPPPMTAAERPTGIQIPPKGGIPVSAGQETRRAQPMDSCVSSATSESSALKGDKCGVTTTSDRSPAVMEKARAAIAAAERASSAARAAASLMDSRTSGRNFKNEVS